MTLPMNRTCEVCSQKKDMFDLMIDEIQISICTMCFKRRAKTYEKDYYIKDKYQKKYNLRHSIT